MAVVLEIVRQDVSDYDFTSLFPEPVVDRTRSTTGESK